ncbi:MAG: hypothetical protein HOP21_08110 [Methylotenera sp.]|nr:hypothetical protein [Methylotenera sp.]
MSSFSTHEAVNTYLTILKNKGANDEVLTQRAAFLDRLLVLLEGKQESGSEYRMAVESAIEIEADEYWHDFLTAAREFYPFWIKNKDMVDVFNRHASFDVDAEKWSPPQILLQDLMDNAKRHQFNEADNGLLNTYATALKNEGIEDLIIQECIGFAKIMLIRLRGAPSQTEKVYRMVVDLTLPIFPDKDNRQLFLMVVREFFYFWIEDPEASTYLLNTRPKSILF